MNPKLCHLQGASAVEQGHSKRISKLLRFRKRQLKNRWDLCGEVQGREGQSFEYQGAVSS